MGRTLPLDCKHGWTIDYGDFGDDSLPFGGAKPCPNCQSEDAARAAARREEVVDCLAVWVMQSGWVKDYQHARTDAEGFAASLFVLLDGPA